MGTIIPGLLIWGMFHLYIFGRGMFASLNQVAPGQDFVEERASVLRSLMDVSPLMSLVVIVIITVYTGWATTLEVAGVGAVMALLVSILSGTFSLDLLKKPNLKTVRLTAALMSIVAGAQASSVALVASGLSVALVDRVNGSGLAAYTILMIIMTLDLVLGTFIDELSMMLMSMTLVQPIFVSLGFDPVWFATLLVISLQIGLLSPPVGMTIFAIKLIAPPNVTLSDITWGTVPFTAILLLTLVLLMIFPSLVLWLPSRMN